MKNFMVLLFLVPLFASAQKTHTVQAKETLYSLARKYNIHPRELAAYNNMPVTTSLTLGQVIKIPATRTMEPLPSANAPKQDEETKKEPAPVVQKQEEKVKETPAPKPAATAKQEGSYPIYHKVEKKETLYHISKLYPNVTIEDLRKWNNLGSIGLNEGTNLIVGYSKTKPADKEQEVVETKQKEETPKPAEAKPVVTKVAEQEKKEPEKKEPEKTVKAEPVKEEEKMTASKDFKGGVFKSSYKPQGNNKEEKGNAGIFKSTSGWDDGKYYCLSNSVVAGTIVKITNPATQKSIYAKVLDLIPDLKQNEGLILRISNAAAYELGAGPDNFECSVNF